MSKKAVGFYWTLPVPHAGFTDLPSDPNEAAKLSRTIGYQLEVVRRWARDNGYELIHEEAFIESSPDRAAKQEDIRGTLNRLINICKKNGADFIHVDFAQSKEMWRRHNSIKYILKESRIGHEALPPDPLMIGGQNFDPREHFSLRREQQKTWSAQKPQRSDLARRRAKELSEEGLSYPKIAARLNEENVLSPTGKQWTADNVRKFLTVPEG